MFPWDYAISLFTLSDSELLAEKGRICLLFIHSTDQHEKSSYDLKHSLIDLEIIRRQRQG